MRFSTKGRYGLRALVELALCSEDGPVSVSMIAKKQNLSERYLEQLFASLRKAGLITSIRGANGGYLLDKTPDQISVGDVLRALEGNTDMVDCPGLTGDGNCDNVDACISKYVWAKMNAQLNQVADDMKLEELIEVSRRR